MKHVCESILFEYDYSLQLLARLNYAGLSLLKKDKEGNVPAAPPGFEPVAEITGEMMT